MKVSALKLDPGDTVACVLRPHAKGERLVLDSGHGPKVRADIPLGHKVALSRIEPGTAVIKYGAPIGRATALIAPGDHVHLHNLRGCMA